MLQQGLARLLPDCFQENRVQRRVRPAKINENNQIRSVYANSLVSFPNLPILPVLHSAIKHRSYPDSSPQRNAIRVDNKTEEFKSRLPKRYPDNPETGDDSSSPCGPWRRKAPRRIWPTILR